MNTLINLKADLKLSKKRHKNLNRLHQIMKDIEKQKALDHKLKDHPLVGNWGGHRELHIEPDWLLIYKVNPEEKCCNFCTHGNPFRFILNRENLFLLSISVYE